MIHYRKTSQSCQIVIIRKLNTDWSNKYQLKHNESLNKAYFSIISARYHIVPIWRKHKRDKNQLKLVSIYSTSTIVYAQQQQHQQPVLSATKNQGWIDKQSNTKVLFTYSPETPLVGGFTELKFNIEDSKRGTHLKDVFARVTIINGLQQQIPLWPFFYRVPVSS